jgi:hypothetical protein
VRIYEKYSIYQRALLISQEAVGGEALTADNKPAQ